MLRKFQKLQSFVEFQDFRNFGNFTKQKFQKYKILEVQNFRNFGSTKFQKLRNFRPIRNFRNSRNFKNLLLVLILYKEFVTFSKWLQENGNGKGKTNKILGSVKILMIKAESIHAVKFLVELLPIVENVILFYNDLKYIGL